MATAEEVARELEILLQALQSSNDKAQRGLAFDWEKELQTKLVDKFTKAGDLENTARAKAADVIEGFGKTMAHLGTAGAKYVQTIGATVDMLNRQSTALNAVNDVMRKQVETTNAMIDAGAQFAKDMVTMFLPGGPMVKFIASAVIGIGTFLLKQKNELDNKLNNAARDMAEKQYKIYSELGQAGANAVGGMDDVARLGAKFNLTTEQMGPLVSAIKDSGKELALLGGSVGGGIKVMERLGSVSKDNEMALRSMGVSMEQVPEYAASYMRTLRLTGRSQEDVTKAGSKAMMEYIQETQILTALTGATRREQEEARALLYEDNATTAAMLELPKEARKRFEDFTQGMVLLDKEFAPLTKGMNALATGTLNSKDSITVMQQMEPAFRKMGVSSFEFMEQLKSGKMTAQQAQTKMLEAMNDPQVKKEIIAAAKVGVEGYGPAAKVYLAAEQHRGKDIAKMTADEKKALEDKQKGLDATTQEAAKTQKTLQDANMEYAKFMQSQMPAALKDGRAAIEKFGSAAEYVAKKLYKDFGIKEPSAPKKSVEQAAAESAAATKTAAAAYEKAQAPGATAEDKAAFQKAAAESQKAAFQEREALLQKQKVERELRLDAKKLAQLEKQQTELEKEGRVVAKNAVTARIQELQTQMAEKKKSIAGAPPTGATGATAVSGIGSLSAKYESGSKGSAAVGFDTTGGASYGKYQIATKTGTMDRFLNFLDKADAESAKRLRAAGPAGERGGGFEQEWQKLVAEGKLQGAEHEFIKQTHYDAALKSVNKTLSDMIVGSKALQEVMWSTSVQHGAAGAASLFNKSFRPSMSEAELIKAVYDARSTQFGSSTPEVQKSVQARLQDEQARATALIGQPTGAADGAILSGPDSGYKPNLTMHGTEAVIPLKNQSVPVEITADSTVGQTLVSLNSVMQELLDSFRVSQDLLERIERSSSNTASASEKTARYAQN